MTAVVRFTRFAHGYRVQFRYDEELLAVVKSLPPDARSWDKVSKHWTVYDPYGERLASDLVQLGCVVVGIGGTEQPDDDPARWARTLLHRVGPQRSDAVFRALTRVLHPDNAATGDTQLQRELNTAREEVMQHTTPGGNT